MTTDLNTNHSPIIHIGYQKTATTYLQTKIFSRSDLFQQPWGIQPPRAIEHFVLEHPESFDPEKVRRDFSAALDHNSRSRPVISHEDLSGYPIYGRYYIDRVAQRLHETFPSARLIVGVRRQSTMLKSQYFQYVRQGGTASLDTLINSGTGREGFRPTIRLDHFDYDRMVRYLAAFFGIENILVLPLELLQREPKTYTRMLLQFCDLPETHSFEREAVLERRPDILMSLERRLNHLVPPPEVFPARYQDTPFMYRAKEKLLRNLERPVRSSRLLNRPDRSIQRIVEQVTKGYYSASNNRLSELTGLDLETLGYDMARA